MDDHGGSLPRLVATGQADKVLDCMCLVSNLHVLVHLERVIRLVITVLALMHGSAVVVNLDVIDVVSSGSKDFATHLAGKVSVHDLMHLCLVSINMSMLDFFSTKVTCLQSFGMILDFKASDLFLTNVTRDNLIFKLFFCTLVCRLFHGIRRRL